MRTRTGLVLALLLALSAAGCGNAADGDGVATAGGRGKATSTATSDGLSERERMIKFARCMRRNGVPDFPDPEVGDDNGEVRIQLPEGADKKKVDAAQQKCKKYLPNGGEPPKADPELLEKLRKYAECMRKNGVPKFPDPTDQGLQINNDAIGMSPEDPRFKAAEKKCAKLLPDGPSGGTRDRSGG